MKASSLFFVSGALIFALGGAFLVKVLMTPTEKTVASKVVVQKEPEVVKPAPTFPRVLAVTKELNPGDFIDGSAVRWVEAKQAYSELTYFLEKTDDIKAVYGATVRETVKQGTVLSNNMVVRAGEPGFIASVLKAGMRAVAIPTNAVSSNAGLVSAGDYVDVILGLNRDQEAASGSAPSGESGSLPKLASQTLLTNVRVLALNNIAHGDLRLRTDQDARATEVKYYETVTLEVSPKAAEQLAVARELGSLQLALRSVKDEGAKSGLVSQSIHRQKDNVTTLNQVTDIYKSFGSATAPVMMFLGESVRQAQ